MATKPRKKKSRTEVPATPSPAPSTPPPASPKDETLPEDKDEKADQHVSLAAEFANLGHAVNAAVIISEALADGGLPTAEATARAPTAITAVLALVHSRLAQVQRVLRGNEDPKTILEPYNATSELSPEEDQEIRLKVWTFEQHAAHHAREQRWAEDMIERVARRGG
ncbi:MAG: hypothetical protein JXB05_26965 [Myxococcaceae bacterium]|nr:hypothetical protein [Myxococcaceae bacterium]